MNRCTRCGRPLLTGQPYMPSIPFLTGHGGYAHQYCPPFLVAPIGSVEARRSVV